MKKKETFADRVRAALEKKGITQSKLAEDARIAPAALSRILANKGRELRMDQLLAIAHVLDTSASELVGGTEEESVIVDWVSRERYEESERARLDAINALELSTAKRAALEAEIEVLRETGKLNAQTIVTLEDERASQTAAVQVAAEQRAELIRLRLENMGARSASAKQAKEIEGLTANLAACRSTVQLATQQTRAMQAWANQTHQQLLAAKSESVNRTAMAAIIAGAAAVFLRPKGR